MRTLIWKVSAVDRKQRRVFARVLRLAYDLVPLAERPELDQILASDRLPGNEIMKFRPYFKEIGDEEIQQLTAEDAQGLFSLMKYQEDEEGRFLDATDFMAAMSGRDARSILVMRDVQSVLRIGKVDLSNASTWNAEKANTVDHFLEVVRCLSASQWIKTPTRVKYTVPDGKNKTISSFTTADVYTLNSVLVFIRQLHARRDELLRRACDIYAEHCPDDAKKSWVSFERQLFERTLTEEPFMFKLGGITGNDLIELFLYGLGLIHRYRPATTQRFRELIAQHGREHVMMAFHGTLVTLVGHANFIYHPMAQDFYHWTKTQGAARPDRVSYRDVLG